MKINFHILISLSLGASLGISNARPQMKMKSSMGASPSINTPSVSGQAYALPIKPLAPRATRSKLRLITKHFNHHNQSLGYKITAQYPQIAGAEALRERKFNREIATMLMKEINEFTKNFRGPKGREIRGEGDSYLEAQYKVEIANTNLVSVWFGITTYASRDARPKAESRVFNYDLHSGRRLRLGDLFKTDAPYLVVISKYCINAIKENIPGSPEDWIEQGAAPTEENYRNWNVNREGLVIMFDNYQVASPAAGPQEITVPYSVLKDMIRPEVARALKAG